MPSGALPPEGILFFAHNARPQSWAADRRERTRLEMQSCGYPNARRALPTHKLTVCYELALEFADLYRTYADVSADGSATADGSKRKAAGASAFRQQLHHKAKRE
jgi:hypothetical protein